MTLERKQRQGHRRKMNQLLLAPARGWGRMEWGSRERRRVGECNPKKKEQKEKKWEREGGKERRSEKG